MVNYKQCGAEFIHSPELQQLYGWNGSITGIPRNHTTQISRHGCNVLCGTGPAWYDWGEISGTVLTWILPIIGTLLQGPFESNENMSSLYAIVRWLGSPIASLSQILWNIKISGKCAVMVDMSTRYEDPAHDVHSAYSSMRDSMFILLNMNQYTMKRKASVHPEAEGLLRIVLFSTNLELPSTPKGPIDLDEARRKLALKLRKTRRGGIVPVFISTGWFVFSLVLTIQEAFGDLGENSTAHDLALGLLMGWFPVLILSCIIDRNPSSSNDMRLKLNKYVDLVRHALMDDAIRGRYLENFRGRPQFNEIKMWIDAVAYQSRHMDDFFQDLAAQGRIRYHYGCAHPILNDIESSYVAKRGRNWLDPEPEARFHLTVGQVPHKGLLWFDPRQLRQIVAALAIVLGNIVGAFILSYFTPTIGLGCRTLGYAVFAILAFALMVTEWMIWWLMTTHWVKSHSSRDVNNEGGHSSRWSEGWITKWSSRCILLPLEFLNTFFLTFTIFAQILGLYNNCLCITSSFGPGGGYTDFAQAARSNAPGVKPIWVAGTTISTTIFGLGVAYVVVEWCLQSHLNAIDYDKGWRGLRRVRRYKRFTYPFRVFRRFLKAASVLVINALLRLTHLPKWHVTHSLRWTVSSPDWPLLNSGEPGGSQPGAMVGEQPRVALGDLEKRWNWQEDDGDEVDRHIHI